MLVLQQNKQAIKSKHCTKNPLSLSGVKLLQGMRINVHDERDKLVAFVRMFDEKEIGCSGQMLFRRCENALLPGAKWKNMLVIIYMFH